jgi:hypothetical protein
MDIKPNIFKIATKELSQDAFITWLLRWSNPQIAHLDYELHKCGMDFLQLLIGTEHKLAEKQVVNTFAERQWKNIDVSVEIEFKDNSKLLLILENKIFAGEHSEQLLRYKENAQQWCEEHGFELSCTFLKIGSETGKVLKEIESKGYKVITRKEIMVCINPYKEIGHPLLSDYIDFLEGLQFRHEAYENIPPAQWDGIAWVGFFQFIESKMEVNMFHFVNNPAGGFWNLSLNWNYWGRYPVYMQIEQRKICFKIAVGEIETGLEEAKARMNYVQDTVHAELISFAKEKGESRIERPAVYVRRGAYRTIAVIRQENWMGADDQIINKESILLNLQWFTGLYNEFMKNLIPEKI